MGKAQAHEPVLLIVGLFSGYPDAFEWAESQLVRAFGAVLDRGGPFPFTETSYYAATMGERLEFRFLAFEELIEATWLGPIKRYTNALEARYAEECQRYGWPGRAVERPLNIDPGYLHHSKWIMATTKDQSHRIYLGQGIYGDPLLRFVSGRWEPWPWTYPNYCRQDYRAMFLRFRQRYLELRRRWRAGEVKLRSCFLRVQTPESSVAEA